MADREKVLNGLECCSESISKACPMECPYRVECLMQDDTSHMYSVMHDALELLKENDIWLERIHQNICAYINGGCSTDTEADKEYICSQIDRIFEGKPVLLDEEVKQDADD